MGRPHETFNKKEREKKKQQKKKDKEKRREERKENGADTKSFDDMIAYVDENGNITSTPPDPSKRKEVKAESIKLGVPPVDRQDSERSGKVQFFDENKGYGFIQDDQSGDKIFVHISDLTVSIAENDKVKFKTKRGFKGLNAVEVSVIT